MADAITPTAGSVHQEIKTKSMINVINLKKKKAPLASRKPFFPHYILFS